MFCHITPSHQDTMQQHLHLSTGQSSFLVYFSSAGCDEFLLDTDQSILPPPYTPHTCSYSPTQFPAVTLLEKEVPHLLQDSEANKNQCWKVLVLLPILSCTSQMTQAQDMWIILLDYIYKYSEHPNFVLYTKISVVSSARYSFIFISQRTERKQRTLFIRHKPINSPNDIWNSPKNPGQT